MGQKRCLEEKNFDDFLVNEEPNPVTELNDKQRAESLWNQNQVQRVRKDRFDVAVGKKDYDAVFSKKLTDQTPDLGRPGGEKSIKKASKLRN